MSTNDIIAKSLVSEMLQDRITNLQANLKSIIAHQNDYYQSTVKNTVNKLLGNSESSYDVTQHFKFQATVYSTLQEMKKTYLDLFGKPWDYVEPTVEPTAPKTRKPRKPRAEKA